MTAESVQPTDPSGVTDTAARRVGGTGANMSDCQFCTQPLQGAERATCLTCVAHVRRQLEELEERYGLLAIETEHHAGERIPGGSAMVALAGGSTGIAAEHAYRTGKDFSHDADEWAGDGASISFELARWEDNWRLIRREPAAVLNMGGRDLEARTLHAAVTYLTRWLDWAAQHSDVFGEFAVDVTRLLGRVRGITRSGPQYDVPCTKCDVPLLLVDVTERDGTKTGVYRCPRCQRRYDDAAYWIAVHQHYVEQVEQQEATG